MNEIPKVYDPKAVESVWYQEWLDGGYFKASLDQQKPRYCIVIPPPNITGSLHLGHALNNSLQDILVRWKRMLGYNTLWLPGTDHAGIATQNVVERKLKEEGKSREHVGRQKFIERVWQWREQSGRTIIEQLKRLGASCDWSRERFTLDEGLSDAVKEVFVRLYDEGLIYRGERLISWCPRCQTALSDIEVEHEETLGKMYYIKYPLAEDSELFLTVATTRPETLLGDTAVAVHPEDPRYNKLIGRLVLLPLTQRKIPIVGDSILVDREFGTGAVKITPGHDFNDEKAGQRHNLATISLLDQMGAMDGFVLSEKALVLKELANILTRKSVSESRKLVVRWLDEKGFLIKTEDHRHSIGKCYRCKTVVEPYRSPQWFVKVNDPRNSLAQPAIEAIRSGHIRMIPESWKNNYFGWMDYIQDWCISRQIWWGHQIPAWYCKKCNAGKLTGIEDSRSLPKKKPLTGQSEELEIPESHKETWQWVLPDAEPMVARKKPDHCKKCMGTEFVQDPDVLDTWFSSALWPFSTLGWPKATDELKVFYPTNTLVTSFDILFFWVARMIMMGLHFMKEIPFKDVYIHALVRDAEGQKMSKSKGNVIDPLSIMEKYGTDALRFTLAAMASPGRDIKLSEQRIEGYRNFANKLWNAARFILINLEGKTLDGETADLSLADCWIRVRLRKCINSVNKHLDAYRFDEAANQLYQFTWHEYCDWYLELIKPRLSGGVPHTVAGATRATMVTTMETLLRLLHPFMPFITEELWQNLPHHGESIVVAPYPKTESFSVEDEISEGIMEDIISVIKEIRATRSELSIPPTQSLKAGLRTIKPDYADRIRLEGEADIRRLAGLSEFSVNSSIGIPSGALVMTTLAGELFVVIEGVDLHKELARTQKKLSTAKAEFELTDQKWNDQEFKKKAPTEVKMDIELRRIKLSQEVFTLTERYAQIKKLLGE
jgi:valyl-tRNA synthetase